MRRRSTFTTVLVGKNSLRREGLARILRSANFRTLASVSCAHDLLDCKVQPCQLLVLIVHSGDDINAAVEQIELFKDRYPDGRIAIVADRYRLDELAPAFRAGASGYFADVMKSDAFIKSLDLVMMGETVFPPEFLTFVLDSERAHARDAAPSDDNNRAMLVSAEDTIAPQLSPREESILRCLIEGDSNKCIARKIDIAEATVKVHVKAILRKIRVQNRTQAAIWGMNNRSLARPAFIRSPPHLSSAVSGRFSDPEREIQDTKRISDAPPLGVINHATNQFGMSRKDINLKTNGGIRLRK